MSDVACFFLEPTGRARRGLRRYASSAVAAIPPCPGPLTYHNALVWIDVLPSAEAVSSSVPSTVAPFLADPRWPERCACGYVFTAADEWQIFCDALFRRTDTGEECTLRDAPAGAMWNAEWMDWPAYQGPDGRCLVVRLPNGHDWMIDGVASNCDAPCQDCGEPVHRHLAKPPSVPCRMIKPRPHKCWVRHGEPPNLHVDKHGNTCNAGAGSILAGTYHGFLHHGKLVSC